MATSIANPRSLVISLALSPRLTKTILTYSVPVFPYPNAANDVSNFFEKGFTSSNSNYAN